MSKGIFYNAKFGDRFKTRDGREVIYLSSERHRDRWGNLTEWTYHNVVVNINGIVPWEDCPPLVTNEVSTYIEFGDIAISSNLKGCADSKRKEREEDIIDRWKNTTSDFNEDEIKDRLCLIVEGTRRGEIIGNPPCDGTTYRKYINVRLIIELLDRLKIVCGIGAMRYASKRINELLY